MAQLILIRHGQASFGQDDYDQLSDLGARQSALLGRWLASCGLKPDRVVVGALRRHRQTAEHCLAALGSAAPPASEWQCDAGLDEYDNDGILEVHWPELAASGNLGQHLAGHADPLRASREMFFAAMERWVACESEGVYRELWPAFTARARAGIVRAAEGLPEGARALVFTSGGVISAVLHGLLGITPRTALELNWTLANTGISVVNERRGRLRLASLNGVPHLESTGEADLLSYR